MSAIDEELAAHLAAFGDEYALAGALDADIYMAGAT